MNEKEQSESSLNIISSEEFRGKVLETGQKYMINTLFDAINSILGVVIGLYLAEEGSTYIFIMSVISTAIALGISSGTSIYEAEYFEQLREIKKIEKHMITNFEEKNPLLAKKAKLMGFGVGIMNFLTPLIIALIFTAVLALLSLSWAFWTIVGLSALILFVTGLIFGKINQLSPLRRGVRMLVIGLVTFVAVYAVGYVF